MKQNNMNNKKTHRSKVLIEQDNNPISTKSNRFELFQDDDNDSLIDIDDKIIEHAPTPIKKEKEKNDRTDNFIKEQGQEQGKKQLQQKKITPFFIEKEKEQLSVPIETSIRIGDGSQFKLHTEWNVWVHDLDVTDWFIENYTNIFTIKTLADFWAIFNNFEKLCYRNYHFFFMRKGINPTWEDDSNCNGGICSIKEDINKSNILIRDLCMYAMNEILVPDNMDVTGIVFSPKNNWAIIKIWNKNRRNNTSELMSATLKHKYEDLSIKFRNCVPERKSDKKRRN